MSKKSLETKPLRTLKGKRLSGSLATPIDTGVMVPLARADLCELRRARFVEKHASELRRQRMAKIPDLARHLDIDFEHLDLTNPDDLTALCVDTALSLASQLIPGFQETGAAREWPLNRVFDLMVDIEQLKNAGIIKTDQDGCIEYLTKNNPEKYARSGQKSEATRKAKTVQNKVAELRATLFPRGADTKSG